MSTGSPPFVHPIRQPARWIANHELVLLAIAAPFLVFPNRWTTVAAGLLVAAWVCRWIARGALTVRTPLDLPISLLLVMTFVSMFASIDLSTSWPKFWGIILGIAIYYALVNTLRSEHDVARMAITLLVVGMVAALFSMVTTDWTSYQYYNLTPIVRHIPTFPSLANLLPTGGIPRFVNLGTWQSPGVPGCCNVEKALHPREIGGTVGMLLPIALAVLLLGHGLLERSMAAVAVLVLGFTLIIAQALGAIAGVAIAVVIILAWRYRWLLFALPFFAILSVVGAYDALVATLSPASTLGGAMLERYAMWVWALQLLRNEPITGVGLNSFDYTLYGLYPMSIFYDPIHAHNFLLQVALDVGVPGLIAMIWILIGLGLIVVSGLRDATDSTSRAIFVGVALGILAFLVFGLMDALTLGAKPGAAMWAMFGLAAALANVVAKGEAPAVGRFPSLLAVGVVFVLGIAFLSVPSLRAVAYLNLGTIQAHRALAEVHGGSPPPRAMMDAARINLTHAVDGGAQTAHTYGLLSDMDGWLGDCDGTVAFARKHVQAGGDQPVLAGFMVRRAGGPSSNDPSIMNAWPLGPIVTAASQRLTARLELPWPPATLLARYTRIIDGTVSRWGPVSEWWEPYLDAAVLANEELHRPDQAAEILRNGMSKATYAQPLACYTPSG